MRNLKNLLFYVLIIGGFLLFMFMIVKQGEPMEAGKSIPVKPFVPESGGDILETLGHNVTHPLSILLLQIVTIILISRMFGFMFKKIGQPMVIGEIIAGIFLGPSFVGLFFPEISAFLFPKSSLPNLQFISQIGLILFMFIVGMELDLKVLKKKAHEAVIISHASIIFPFALGVGLAYFMYHQFAPAGVTFLSYALFTGIALSITAFPVLARIVQERQLTKTRLGAIAITCAAADDITAWCILAVVIAISKAGSLLSAGYIILMAIAYVLLMLKVVQPFLKRLGDIHSGHDTLSKPVVAVFLVTLLISACIAEIIGIHALFGAFMAGVIMPQNLNFRNIFIEKVEDVSLVLLLPLFFVFTGLRTQIGLLNESHLWGTCAVIIALAVCGKFLGSTLAAKFVGQSWQDSLSIGALMNTRGLMELIVLNIGFDLGILTPAVFAMMVIMALVTTFMTGPALDLINYLFRKSETPHRVETEKYRKYRVLFSFADPERGRSMLRLINSLAGKNLNNATLCALHLEPSNELHQYNIHEVERESFKPLKREAGKLNLQVETLFKPTQDLKKEIIDTANEGDYDLLIIGMGQSIYEGSFLGRLLGITSRIINPEKLYQTLTGKEKMTDDTGFDDRTNTIVRSVQTEIGIFGDKGLKKVEQVTLLVLEEEDLFLMGYAQKMIHNTGARISVVDHAEKIKHHAIFKEHVRAVEQSAPGHMALYPQDRINGDFLQSQDLLMMSLGAWKKVMELEPAWLIHTPSLLILRKA
jgi:Kef-type K+ transport system membrane component KefB